MNGLIDQIKSKVNAKLITHKIVLYTKIIQIYLILRL